MDKIIFFSASRQQQHVVVEVLNNDDCKCSLLFLSLDAFNIFNKMHFSHAIIIIHSKKYYLELVREWNNTLLSNSKDSLILMKNDRKVKYMFMFNMIIFIDHMPMITIFIISFDSKLWKQTVCVVWQCYPHT